MKKKILVGATMLAALSLSTIAYASVQQSHGTSSAPGKLVAGKTYTVSQLGITVLKPPAGFNPLTASNAQLEKYGFPKRPANPRALQAWKAHMSHLDKFVTPTFKATAHKSPNSGSAAGANSGNSGNPAPYDGVSEDWSNWFSGEIADTPDSSATNGYDKVTSVTGTWTVPNVSDPNGPSGWSDSQEYVGFDDWFDSHATWLGTEQDNYVGSPDQTGYYVWWEVLNYNSWTEINNISVSPGDSVTSTVTYNTDNSMTFNFTDNTNGEYTSFNVANMSSYYTGHDALWGEGPGSPLAKFGSVKITGADYTVNGTQVPAQENGFWSVRMKDSSTNDTLANVNNLDSFTDNWYGYQ